MSKIVINIGFNLAAGHKIVSVMCNIDRYLHDFYSKKPGMTFLAKLAFSMH